MSSIERILLVPGGGGSGPSHWHHAWAERDGRCEWVVQADWNSGTVDDWVAVLDQRIHESDAPTVLVAHSVGVVVAVHWAIRHAGPVVGALLVAPADTEAGWVPPQSLYEQFRPVPLSKLPFPSITVASSDDPYLTITRAEAMTSAWESQLRVVGDLGHIGSDAGLGAWEQGRVLLDEVIGTITAP